MQAQLDATKLELQSMMTHWRKEWRDQVIKWSDEVKSISTDEKASECIAFPTDSNYSYLIHYAKFSVHNVTTATTYWENHAPKKLGQVPINLAIDVVRHFVISFGKVFSTESTKTNYYHWESDKIYNQWLWIDEENKRHREIIHTVLDHSSTSTTSLSNDVSVVKVVSARASDGWVMIRKEEIQVGGKLLAVHYIKELAMRLTSHQVQRMIECHFCNSDRRSNETSELVETAKRFEKLLYFKEGTGIYVVVDSNYLQLVGRVTSCDSREMMKNFNLEQLNKEHCTQHNWARMLQNPQFVSSLNGKSVVLTAADVQFIIRSRIDAYYDAKELIEKISSGTGETELPAEFPTADDDFSDFDFPHLRGILAETVLSQKLAKHSLSMKEINEGQFATIAPTALVEIVSSYYPIDHCHFAS